ncbi:DNA polymerase Y family protein [Shewanella gelidimarina]|uniref:Y-family DNA polymerase n=1 Tax=Shewanella gelidimarina TaxID=56813 RepID=UPI00200D794E|nr:DNA polymerase Y family protein [Shewanella gelidimarina]MCL1060407.1 DNA polymerase Y family protein [Shewanella gelidimarina]
MRPQLLIKCIKRRRSLIDMLWLAAHYPQWALQYFCYRNELNQSAEVLLYDPKSLHVLALDAVSQQAGVTVGMSLSTAQSLMPSVMLAEFDSSISQQASDWLCQWSYEFSARVVPLRCALVHDALKAGRSSTKLDVDEFVCNTLLLEVSSMALIFNGIDKLIEQYDQRAKSHGLEVSLAIGKTPLAAQLLAQQSSITTVAVTNSDLHHIDTGSRSTFHQPPPTVNKHHNANIKANIPREQNDYLNPDKSHGLLNQLPVALLPISPFLKQSFLDIGISSFASLCALPDKELGRRFGPKLLQLLARVSGALPHPLTYFEPEETYLQKLALLYEVELMQGIVFPLGRMLKEMGSYLQQRQLAIQQLKLTLYYRDSDRSSLDIIIEYPFAEHRSDHLLSLCRMQLERITLYQPVVEMAISVDKFVPMVIANDNWFGQQAAQGQRSEKAKRLMALLQARLGGDKVKGLQVTSAHLPEEAWQATDLSTTGHEHRPVLKSLQQLSGIGHSSSGLNVGACRPSWLLVTPEMISIETIELLKGPERLQTLWWQEPEVCRDYYIASHQQGGLCWVFKDGNGYFLHGWFG